MEVATLVPKAQALARFLALASGVRGGGDRVRTALYARRQTAMFRDAKRPPEGDPSGGPGRSAAWLAH